MPIRSVRINSKAFSVFIDRLSVSGMSIRAEAITKLFIRKILNI